VVTPGDVQDRHIIAPLLAIARERFPSLKRAIADGGYQGKLTADEVQQQAGIPLEIVKRSDVAKGFHILPKRWIVERMAGSADAGALSKTTRTSRVATSVSSFLQ
jgi:putative transposase